jgi:methionyl-tRNA formyltransferase
MRTAFLGTARFAVPALARLLASGLDVAAVYTRPPRPSGRGHKLQPSAVHAFAESHGLAVRTPVSLKDPAEQAAFATLGLDVAVVAAYGLILPAPILAAPRLGCINIHASLLPRWRGAAPIEWAILAGDAETGVTIMQVDEGLDTGPVLLAEAVPITPETTAETLGERLAALGADLMVAALAGLAAGTLTPRPQPDVGATYAAKLKDDDGRLDWNRPAVELERMVRALNPRPGVWFECAGERIRVLAAELVAFDSATAAEAVPGTILDQRLTVKCGKGAFRPLKVQRPGRAAMASDAFLRGYPLPAGSRLP